MGIGLNWIGYEQMEIFILSSSDVRYIYIPRFYNLGDIENALCFCYQVIGFLYMIFSAINPHHPLLGLQLYTLGEKCIYGVGVLFIYYLSYRLIM